MRRTQRTAIWLPIAAFLIFASPALADNGNGGGGDGGGKGSPAPIAGLGILALAGLHYGLKGLKKTAQK